MALGGYGAFRGRVEGFLESHVYSSRGMMEFLLMFLLVYIVLDAVILAWFFLVPYMAGSSSRLLFGMAMLGYNQGYLVSNCHQMFQRSLIFGGYEMPFCARDTGIYVGCLVGAVLPFANRRLPRRLSSPWVCALLMAPLAVDGVSQTILDMRESTNLLRVVTGLLFGFGMVYVFSARIVERSRGMVDVRGEAVKALRLGALTVAALLAAGYYVGGSYVTLREAVSESGLNPSFVTYASRRSLETVGYDPYLRSYDDSVLDEMVEYGGRGNGVWVVYAGPMSHPGKDVFFRGDGVFRLVSDVNST